jgi:hypothetical protein
MTGGRVAISADLRGDAWLFDVHGLGNLREFEGFGLQEQTESAQLCPKLTTSDAAHDVAESNLGNQMKRISQQSSYAKTLSALTHLYLELSLPFRAAVRAAEADLEQLNQQGYELPVTVAGQFDGPTLRALKIS